MKKTLLIFLFLIKYLSGFSQEIKVQSLPNTKITTIHIASKNSTISGIFIGDTTIQKPLIIYCQGSLPRPIFLTVQDSINYLIPPNQIFKNEKYHYLILSKPGIPLKVNYNKLTHYQYIDSITHLAPKEYITNDYLGFYINLYDDLITQYASKKYIDKINITIMGHSQGARIALKVALKNNFIKKLIYLSSDPLGRYYALQNNCDENSENAWKNCDSLKIAANLFLSNPTSSQLFAGETYKSWASYSEILIDDFLMLSKPVFVGYGDKDKNCPNCDLIDLISKTNKRVNISIHKYKNYDHSFIDVTEKQGKRIKTHWDKIMSDIYLWLPE